LPAMRALGVAALASHLTGALSLADAVERAKTETRQYAKRQLTWLKRNMCSWNAVSTQQSQSTEAHILAFIDC
jgi:tRNA dimethylallyltransferase